ncbi:MAG: metallopeptidase family protein [Pseudomonadota bacterium]|nr:metallopeptidase family protein [Pseudomonadota bacterium]
MVITRDGKPFASPDAATIERLAHAAVTRLPPAFRDHLVDVVFRVQDFADDQMLRSVGLVNAWDLIGLYHGHPLTQQSIWSSGDMPSVISLFRLPLLRAWERRDVSLDEMVTHVIVHEVGHHFGLSDADMHGIENEPS